MICSRCNEEKPKAAFYRTPGRVCKDCLRAVARSGYVIRRLTEESTRCAVCGEAKAPEHMSSQAPNLCKTCYGLRLLRKKDDAPAKLKCRVCKEVKPKEEFAKYSTTCCRSCASRRTSEIYRRKKYGYE